MMKEYGFIRMHGFCYDFDGKSETYTVKRKGNGVYAMVMDGTFEVEGQKLEKKRCCWHQ